PALTRAVVPFAGEVIVTTGGWSEMTVTVAAVELGTLPKLSVTCATTVYVPAAVGVHVPVNGAVLAVATTLPLARNRTDATVPSVAAAEAVRLTGLPAPTEVPLVGRVRVTVGGALSRI